MSTPKNVNNVTFGFHAFNNSLGKPLIDSEDVKNMNILQKLPAEDFLSASFINKQKMIKNLGVIKEEENILETLVSTYQIKFDENIRKHRIDFFDKEKLNNFNYSLNHGYIFHHKKENILISVRKFLPSWNGNTFKLKLWLVLNSTAKQPYILINEDFGILLWNYCNTENDVSILSVNFLDKDFSLSWSNKMKMKNKDEYYKPIPILSYEKNDKLFQKASLRTLLLLISEYDYKNYFSYKKLFDVCPEAFNKIQDKCNFVGKIFLPLLRPIRN